MFAGAYRFCHRQNLADFTLLGLEFSGRSWCELGLSRRLACKDLRYGASEIRKVFLSLFR